MPIIYLKNPRSGSHFRSIGGRAAPTGARQSGGHAGVSWASCPPNKVKFTQPQWAGNPYHAYNTFVTYVFSILFPFTGERPSRTAFVQDKKPCR